MSRLPLLSMQKAGLFTRLIDWVLRRQSPDPRVPSAASIYGYNTPVLLSFVAFGAGYLRWKALPARLKRLVHLRTAMRVGCPS